MSARKKHLYIKATREKQTSLYMMSSTAKAVSKFAGHGMPWVIIVDSKATTGSLAFKAVVVNSHGR
jgi:hypothetical protein